jgi:acyl carrier protein
MSKVIFNRLKGLISTHLGIEESEIKPDSHLQEDFDADPLSIADLLVGVEKDFGVRLDKNQTAQISTVEDILNIISDQIGDI